MARQRVQRSKDNDPDAALCNISGLAKVLTGINPARKYPNPAREDSNRQRPDPDVQLCDHGVMIIGSGLYS
jgi:hypothetical protein